MALTLYSPKPRNRPHEGRLNVYKLREDGNPDLVPDHSSNYPKAYSSPEESDDWLVVFAGYVPGSDLSWYSLYSDKDFSLTTCKLTEGLQSGVYSKALEAMAASEPDGQGMLHLVAFKNPPRSQTRVARSQEQQQDPTTHRAGARPNQDSQSDGERRDYRAEGDLDWDGHRVGFDDEDETGGRPKAKPTLCSSARGLSHSPSSKWFGQYSTTGKYAMRAIKASGNARSKAQDNIVPELVDHHWPAGQDFVYRSVFQAQQKYERGTPSLRFKLSFTETCHIVRASALKTNKRIDKGTEGYVGRVRQGDAIDPSTLATRKADALTWEVLCMDHMKAGSIPPEMKNTDQERVEQLQDMQLADPDAGSSKKRKRAERGSTSQSAGRPALGEQPSAPRLTYSPVNHGSAATAAAAAAKFLLDFPQAAALLRAAPGPSASLAISLAQAIPPTIIHPGPTTSSPDGTAAITKQSALSNPAPQGEDSSLGVHAVAPAVMGSSSLQPSHDAMKNSGRMSRSVFDPAAVASTDVGGLDGGGGTNQFQPPRSKSVAAMAALAGETAACGAAAHSPNLAQPPKFNAKAQGAKAAAATTAGGAGNKAAKAAAAAAVLLPSGESHTSNTLKKTPPKNATAEKAAAVQGLLLLTSDAALGSKSSTVGAQREPSTRLRTAPVK